MCGFDLVGKRLVQALLEAVHAINMLGWQDRGEAGLLRHIGTRTWTSYVYL